MNEYRFKIGDWVRHINGDDRVKKGATGTVKELSSTPYVKWDSETMLLNKVDSNTWAVTSDEIELIKTTNMTELDNTRKILDDLVAEFDKAVPKQPKPKLTTWEECAEVVKPTHFVDDRGHLQWINLGYNNGTHDFNEVPTSRHAKSVLAMCQLMTIAEALNGEYEGGDKKFWFVDRYNNGVRVIWHSITDAPNPIRFTSRESAQHSIDHFKQLWMDYFMVEVDG